eukprot:CAMPEP_0119285058 /NCGR_PEP_ID=MMETSP1329-20130426/31471_1 /TAXON_ID=114041 /ORGANISM="Genus nov. species nov., Strain RCC1024" /LENGTH=606 /DNA_ID=CAMNT_0007285759 /DNA_START=70 /DNA_END=1887 /DNA_ORIENTATION=-
MKLARAIFALIWLAERPSEALQLHAAKRAERARAALKSHWRGRAIAAEAPAPGDVDAGAASGASGVDALYAPSVRASKLESVVANAASLSPFGTAARRKDRGAVALRSMACGLAVALAMVPEAVSFAYVAGVNPLVGLWTTVALGLVAAGVGRAGVTSGASGAVSVVVAGLCAAKGAHYLPACAMVAGALQVGAGVAGLGKFIRLVPHPVMLGFVNGLTLVMLRAQLGHFKDAAGAFLPLRSSAGASAYGLAAATVALCKALPRVPGLGAVPPSLGAVVVASAAAAALGLPVTTLADGAGADTFRGGLAVLPRVGLPRVPLSAATLGVVWPYAVTMAAVGCIESLLTMQLVDGMVDDGARGSTRRECVGQGLGNVASGLTGGIGGCALLGQSVINAESGGAASRLSGASMALFLAAGIVGFAPLLGKVPIASLVGVMLVVCQSTFSWSSLRILRRIPRLDAFVIGLVSWVTVRHDLAKAVVAGVVASALGFAWKQSTKIAASARVEPETQWKSYALSGPLFFGSTTAFADLFDVANDPENVVLDFDDCRVADHSALEAINDLAARYGALGKTVHLRRLSSDCSTLLRRLSGTAEVPYNIIKDSDDP